MNAIAGESIVRFRFHGLRHGHESSTTAIDTCGPLILGDEPTSGIIDTGGREPAGPVVADFAGRGLAVPAY